MRQQWRLWLATVAAGVVAASLFASPALASGGRATSAARGSSLKVSIAVERFARTSRGRTIARGVAVARLNDYTGKSTTKVNLTVTGQAHGGVLGSLFCKLARSHVSSARVAALHALNARLRHHAIHPLGFTVPISPKVTTSQATPCPVLNLVLGPLNLNLLGLVVDLNRVTLTITATPGGGALGDLFCSLSH